MAVGIKPGLEVFGFAQVKDGFFGVCEPINAR